MPFESPFTGKPEEEEVVLKVPVIPDGEITKYHLIGQESGKVWGNITRYVNKVQQEGKEYYKLFTKTEFLEEEDVEETTILEIREALFPISYQRTAKDKNGKVLSDAKLIYEGEPLELNSVPQGAIAFCTRGGPFILKGGHFAPKSKTTLSLMPGEKRNSLKISLEFSKEKVKVPAGTFDCYKAEVTIDPDSMMSMMPPGFKVPPGVLNLMKQFMPPINRWFSQEEPHYPVKSEGFSDFMMSSMSPSGISEPIAEELVSIERKAA